MLHLAVMSLYGLLLIIGVWGLIASEGEPDPDWTWGAHLATMAVTLAALLASAALAFVVYRWLYPTAGMTRSHQRDPPDPAARSS